MDSFVSPKDEIWFLRVCHHISNAVYLTKEGKYYFTGAKYDILVSRLFQIVA